MFYLTLYLKVLEHNSLLVTVEWTNLCLIRYGLYIQKQPLPVEIQ